MTAEIVFSLTFTLFSNILSVIDRPIWLVIVRYILIFILNLPLLLSFGVKWIRI